MRAHPFARLPTRSGGATELLSSVPARGHHFTKSFPNLVFFRSRARGPAGMDQKSGKSGSLNGLSALFIGCGSLPEARAFASNPSPWAYPGGFRAPAFSQAPFTALSKTRQAALVPTQHSNQRSASRKHQSQPSGPRGSGSKTDPRRDFGLLRVARPRAAKNSPGTTLSRNESSRE